MFAARDSDFKTGWSSIAFGATPVCPCGMSKKPDAGQRRGAGQVAEGARGRRAAPRDQLRPGLRHRRLLGRGRCAVTGRVRELRDHRLRWLARCRHHQVDVVVVLELHLNQADLDPPARGLDTLNPRGRGADTWRGLLPQPVDGRVLGLEVDQPLPLVGERLDRPSLLAALGGAAAPARSRRCCAPASRPSSSIPRTSSARRMARP